MNKAVRGALTMMLSLAMASAAWADVGHDASLIQRLGRQEIEHARQAAKPPTKAEVLAASKMIDEYLQANYKAHHLQPNPRASDDVWLRRVYLDIAGRIPTLQESLAFRRSHAPDKRTKLIDQLLDSEGFISTSFNFWADVLRIQSNPGEGRAPSGVAYVKWMKQALRQNMPYNTMVYDLLTAKGYPWENGAVGYFERDSGMPLDNMALTTEAFLGTSLVCAQCHDHPFDKWKQRDFYQMAAYTYGVRTRWEPPNIAAARKLLKQKDPGNERVMFSFNNLVRSSTYGVHDTDRLLKFPHDYKYKNATPDQVVSPSVIFGRAQADGDDSLRETYARWVTDRQNPRFTLTVANRLWKRVFGIGLIEPVDQMTDSSKASMPELMSFLTYKMAAFNYDMKAYLKMLYNSDLYSRSVTVKDIPEGAVYRFPGPLLHRMSAEQFWDSLITLIIPDPDHRPGPSTDDGYMSEAQTLASMPPDELVAYVEKRADSDYERRELRKQIKEAMQKHDEKLVEQLRDKMRDIHTPALPRLAGTGGGMMDTMNGGAMNARRGGAMTAPPLLARHNSTPVDTAKWAGYPAAFVRASKLKSPESFSHFLRQFGQSDRDVPNDANANANLIQVLAMFNGPMFKHVMAPNSQVMQAVAKVSTPNQKVEVIFLSLLNREPTAYEHEVLARLVKTPDYGKIIWAILNTREFSFVQ